jgi:hypothetical protein
LLQGEIEEPQEKIGKKILSLDVSVNLIPPHPPTLKYLVDVYIHLPKDPFETKS